MNLSKVFFFGKCRQLGEKARVEIVKNTGHVPNGEDPRRFNEILLEFLMDGLQTSK